MYIPTVLAKHKTQTIAHWRGWKRHNIQISLPRWWAIEVRGGEREEMEGGKREGEERRREGGKEGGGIRNRTDSIVSTAD